MKSIPVLISALFTIAVVCTRCGVPLPASAAEPTEFSVYGFVKADVIYDFKRMHPDWNSTLRPSQIIVRGPDTPFFDEGEFIYSLKASRLGADFSRQFDTHRIEGKVEIDFFGVGSNQGQQLPRLRQAYVKYGEVLVGQTWSLFNDSDIWPLTMDFWGPSGMMSSRRPQVRWTPVDNADGVFAIAFEQSGAGLDAGKGPQYDPDLDVRARSVLPDLTVQFRRSGERGHFQVAGVVRSLSYEGSYTDMGDVLTFAESVPGWGGYLSGRWRTGGASGVNASFAYGEGIANYANDGGLDVGPDADLQAEALPYLGWHVSYDNWWSGRWSSSLGASQAIQDNLEGQEAHAFHKGTYTFINLVYHPQAGLSYGLEFLWGERRNNDGDSNDDYRLNFAARFGF